jgi:uncharacterized protein
MRRLVACALMLALTAFPGWAADKVRLSVATGGTGGVYYPLGGALARVISKYVPNVEATAEVTSASVDNIKLVAVGKADIAFSLADTAWDGYHSLGKFKEKVPMRSIAVLYPNKTHVVTVEGAGIEKMADLKGKRLSTGAPGSGTEVIALWLLEACGIDPEKEVKREKLSVAELVSALKDRKIEAFIWSGGIPTAAVTDLTATPGLKIKLIEHADALGPLVKKYGPLYVRGIILAKSYPGQDKDVAIIDGWNVLVVNEKMDEKLVYDIVTTLFEKKSELVAIHKEAADLNLETQLAGGSPIPFHPGALKYFAEKGLQVR